MKETFYPSLDEVLFLHRHVIEEFGGSEGVTDKGLLESALMRPRSGYYQSLSEQAAALLQSLALNHPFVDGNKRVAFAVTAIFLRMNGYKLSVDTADGKKFIESDLIAGRMPLQETRLWLEQRMISA